MIIELSFFGENGYISDRFFTVFNKRDIFVTSCLLPYTLVPFFTKGLL